MTNPFEDSWGDLAAELGVQTEKPARALEPVAEPDAIEPAPADLIETVFAEATVEIEEANETGVIELGGTDEQKKRRRRRRRKKRDGEPADEAEGGESPNDGLAQPSELLRELIRNWDVPSWDEIVGGLYRPNRG